MSSERSAAPTGNPLHFVFRNALLVGGEATRLYLIRHAQSEGNTGEDLTTGDPDLTDVGRAQAERLGKRMKDARLDALYSSPLRRTQATARAIADTTGLEIVSKEDLREVTLGPPELDIRELPIAEQQKIESEVLADGTWDAFPGSEGSTAARQRIRSVLDEIIASHPGQRVATVVHAAFIQTYVSIVLGLDRDFIYYPFNASICSVRAREDRRVLWRLNDVSHLADMPAGWGGIS